jgi:phage-related protein
VRGRRWRVYTTRSGRCPVRDFIATLTDEEAADVASAMSDVRRDGVRAAKHVEGEIFEVKADSDRQTFRILFAQEGAHDQVLLALEAFSKKQQRLPRSTIDLAKQRLRDWRSRAR